TDEAGHGSFSFSSDTPSVGDGIMATATDGKTLDTSGFSACKTVTAAAAAFVVTTADDHDDGICDFDCTLREAVNASNISEGLVHVSFAIDASGTQQIALASPLPNLTNPVVIDGTTQAAHQA